MEIWTILLIVIRALFVSLSAGLASHRWGRDDGYDARYSHDDEQSDRIGDPAARRFSLQHIFQ